MCGLPLRERIIVKLASIDLRPRALIARVPFVVLVIGSLGAGLGTTLWLSTDAAERSYSSARPARRIRLCCNRRKRWSATSSRRRPPALAEAARELGMIPSRDTAHLVQDPAGNWIVVGAPKPAEGVPPPPLNSPLPEIRPPPPPPPPAPASWNRVNLPFVFRRGLHSSPRPVQGRCRAHPPRRPRSRLVSRPVPRCRTPRRDVARTGTGAGHPVRRSAPLGACRTRRDQPLTAPLDT